MRLIDADELKRALANLVVGGEEKLKDYYENGSKADENAWIGGIYDAWELIDNAPTVEYTFEEAFQKTVCENRLYCPARPQGEWITRHKLNSFGQDVVCFECNKCGEYKVPLYHLLITEPLKVCPNCGAAMQKGGAE